MTKDTLISAGLTEEQADKILSELANDYVPKADHDQLAADLKAARLANAQKDKDHAAELKQLRMNTAVDQALDKANAMNKTAVQPFLKAFLEKAELADDGTIAGLDEEIQRLAAAEDTGFLFRTETQTPAATTISGAAPSNVPTKAPDTKSSSYEARLQDARKSGNSALAVSIKREAAADGVMLY
ncbi:MAG: phage scaffolding protein [Butyricicoccus sp.]